MGSQKYEKILNHPDRDQIISKLTAGESVREVSAWLKEKYPNTKPNQLAFTTLDEFRRKYLNIHGTILDDLKIKFKEQQAEEVKDGLKHIVKKNKSYQEKLDEFIDDKIDWRKKLVQFLNVAETRFSQVFDKSQNNPDSFRGDETLIKWMKEMRDLVIEIRKAEGAPDQVIQHNVTVQAIDEQANIIHQAIFKTLMKMDFSFASVFIDQLNETLRELGAEQKEISMFASNADMERISNMADKLLVSTSSAAEIISDDEEEDDVDSNQIEDSEEEEDTDSDSDEDE